MAKIKLITSNTGKNAEKLDDSHIAGGNVKLNSHSGKRVLTFLIKLNTHLPYDPAITFLEFTQRNGRFIHKKSYTQMFREALFIIAMN